MFSCITLSHFAVLLFPLAHLFLEFIDYTHRYALKELRAHDTTRAANLAFNLLKEPLFKYKSKADGHLVVLPLLASTEKTDQYYVNWINPCPYVDSSENWGGLDKFKQVGYLISYKDSIDVSDKQSYPLKIAAFDFIPNDAEYTIKLNDLAYFMQLGGYDSLAKVILEQIVNHHPDRTVAHLNLADALYNLGERAKARVYYQNYVARCRKNKVADSKIPRRVFDRI